MRARTDHDQCLSFPIFFWLAKKTKARILPGAGPSGTVKRYSSSAIMYPVSFLRFAMDISWMGAAEGGTGVIIPELFTSQPAFDAPAEMKWSW